jgi:hypothetical protein
MAAIFLAPAWVKRRAFAIYMLGFSVAGSNVGEAANRIKLCLALEPTLPGTGDFASSARTPAGLKRSSLIGKIRSFHDS